MKIAVSCGGTGGHMFPGLAVASELARNGHSVKVVLSGRSVESSRSSADLPKNIGTITIPVRPFSASKPWTLPQLGRAIIKAYIAFRRERPDVLLAMGAYTSVPPVLVARLLKIPIFLHEANAIPGKAVAKLARFATGVCLTFPEAKSHFPQRIRFLETGVPLRGDFSLGCGGSKSTDGCFSVLIMGGSQGAQRVNTMVVEALALIRERDSDLFKRIRVTHLAGTRNEETVRAHYIEKGLIPSENIQILGFSQNMSEHYARANYCISRAGASSCFELALVGLPTLLIPLPRIARNHQTFNARSFHNRHSADMLEEDILTPALLADHIIKVATTPSHLASLRENILRLAKPDAAIRVATFITQ